MSHYVVIMIINLSLFALPFITATCRLSKLDNASMMLWILTGVSLIGESMAYAAAFILHNNGPVYAILNIYEMAAVCLYYSSCISFLQRYRFSGWILAFISVVVGIVNIAFFQSLLDMDSNFLQYEGGLTLLLALISIADIIKRKGSACLKDVHFYFAIIMIFFWTATFPAFGMYDYLTAKMPDQKFIIDYFILIVCSICNIAYFFVFLFINRQKNVYAQ